MTDTTTNAGVPATTSENATPAVISTFKRANSFYKQPGVQRALPSIAAAIVTIIGIILFVALQSPERTTLFSSLSEAEKSRVFEALKNGGVDVQIDSATGELTVPVNSYHSAKLNLAAQGIPMQTAEGYGAIDNMPMGTSRSVESIKIKQSIEYELARSIAEIESISTARVHLAIPEKSAFARNSQDPSASVFVELFPGRALNSQQVEAIVNLVASSVPSLSKSKVSIIDQSGRLLSNAIVDPASTTSDLHFQYRMRIEELYRSRIERLLTPIVGAGNVSAQVNVDVDFTAMEITEDLVLPDSVALISQQKSKDEEVSSRALGIPGSVANEPPPQSSFKTTEEMPRDDVANETQESEEGVNQDKEVGKYASNNETAATTGGGSKMVSSNEVQNYEVSRQISTKKMPSAQITKVSVAVLLREQSIVNPDGQVQTLEISEEEKVELKELVSNALGLTSARGDTVIISSRPFIMKLAEGISPSWHEQPWLQELMTKSIMLLIIGVVSLAVIRPLLSRLLTPSQDMLKNAYLEEQAEDLEAMQGPDGQSLEDLKAKLKPKASGISAEMLDTANSYDDKVAIVRMMVADEAGRVSNVFKTMMQRDLDVIS